MATFPVCLIPEDRVINFATADKSQVAFTVRKPDYLLVGLDDKSVNFVDVNTGKANETMKIPVEAIPVDAALTPRGLADMLLNMERPALMERALKAKNMQKTQATREVVAACEELVV